MTNWTECRIGGEPAANAGDVTNGSAAGVTNGPGFTVYELDSGVPGPTVVVLGGVHGNEVGGVLAAGRLTSNLTSNLTSDLTSDADELAVAESSAGEPSGAGSAGGEPSGAGGLAGQLRAGRLRVVPVTHEAAYGADSRVSPADGLNLARVFPGRPDGEPTERLAHLVTEELLRSADVLIDLHTSSPDTDMPLFAGCLDDGSATANRAVELAVAFGAPAVWTHGRLGPGRSLTVAASLGIPAIYVESPVGGVLDASHLQAYTDGVRRVLAALGMVDGAPPGWPSPLWLHGDGDVDAFSQVGVDGLFHAEVRLLDLVETGQVIGTVLDSRSRLLERVHALDTGHVVTLRRTAHVRPGTPVAGIVPARPALLGLPSDSLVTTPGVLR